MRFLPALATLLSAPGLLSQELPGKAMTCWDKKELCDLNCVFPGTRVPGESAEDCDAKCLALESTCQDGPATNAYVSCAYTCAVAYDAALTGCNQKASVHTKYTVGANQDACANLASGDMDNCMETCYGSDRFNGWTPDTEEGRPPRMPSTSAAATTTTTTTTAAAAAATIVTASAAAAAGPASPAAAADAPSGGSFAEGDEASDEQEQGGGGEDVWRRPFRHTQVVYGALRPDSGGVLTAFPGGGAATTAAATAAAAVTAMAGGRSPLAGAAAPPGVFSGTSPGFVAGVVGVVGLVAVAALAAAGGKRRLRSRLGGRA